jgi:hypothetical protein
VVKRIDALTDVFVTVSVACGAVDFDYCPVASVCWTLQHYMFQNWSAFRNILVLSRRGSGKEKASSEPTIL